jgi:ABC-type transport system involved in cytochrome bd biosynthesis fused ATPase/permease subunit
MSEDFLDRMEDDEEELYRSYVRPVSPLKAKIFLWLAIVGGIAAGVVLFLFFITLFIYVFLPAALVLSLWFAFQRWKFNRDWRRMTKNL